MYDYMYSFFCRKLSKENDLLYRMQQTHQNKITDIDCLIVEKQVAFEIEVFD